MPLKLEAMIAIRYLRSKRSEGFISIITMFSLIGIALGIASLIIVMSVMNGFREEITKKILGLNGHINISSYTRNMENFENLANTIEKFDNVEYATPVIDGQAMAIFGDNTVGSMVKAMRIEDIINEKPAISKHIISGSLEDLKTEGTIMLGSRLAMSLGALIGDSVTLVSPQGQSTAIGTMPRLKSYKVAAIFEAGMYDYDSSVIFMPLASAQVFFRYPNSVSGIEIITKDPHMASDTASKIYNETKGLFMIRDWQTMNSELFNALKIERNVMFLILTLIVFIAAFNIISSLIMLVNDKEKDIAILRTMGATKSMIMRIFIMCGSIIGIIGTFSGFILGIGFSYNIDKIKKGLESLTGAKLFDPVIYFLSELPSKLQTSDVLWSVSMGLIFSFIATIYPSWKASRKNPAEALRYE